MKVKKNIYTTIRRIILIAYLVCLTVPATASENLHTIWSELLGKHVIAGVVDYKALKSKENRLDEYLQILDATDPQLLPEAEKLAFYINAYNAYTVKLILNNFIDGRPVDSIKDLGGFFSGPWKIEFCRIAGKIYTLDNIEHDIIRPNFKEPRIHFAVNCASQSCPPLISEAYAGTTIDEQLQENTLKFINNNEFNRLNGNTLYVSKIFKWFPEDFDNDIAGFFRQYAQGSLKSRLMKLGDEVTIKYLEYDWSLNNR